MQSLALDPSRPVAIVATYRKPATLGQCGSYSAVMAYRRSRRSARFTVEVREHCGTHDVIHAVYDTGTNLARIESACHHRDRLACIDAAKKMRLVAY